MIIVKFGICFALFLSKFAHCGQTTTALLQMLAHVIFHQPIFFCRFLGSEDPNTFFSRAQRSRMVYEILATTPFGKEKKGEVGIERMVDEGAYSAAFPLHDVSFFFFTQCGKKSRNISRFLLFSFCKKWYFSSLGMIDKTFQLVRGVFSFHVEMFFLLSEPKASLVIKRSKHEI